MDGQSEEGLRNGGGDCTSACPLRLQFFFLFPLSIPNFVFPIAENLVGGFQLEVRKTSEAELSNLEGTTQGLAGFACIDYSLSTVCSLLAPSDLSHHQKEAARVWFHSHFTF